MAGPEDRVTKSTSPGPEPTRPGPYRARPAQRGYPARVVSQAGRQARGSLAPHWRGRVLSRLHLLAALASGLRSPLGQTSAIRRSLAPITNHPIPSLACPLLSPPDFLQWRLPPRARSMLAQSMGREGEWSASSQSPGPAPQFSAYGAPYGAPPGQQQQQQQYPPGAAAPMQPPGMMRGGGRGGAMPVQYGSAPPSSAGGGLGEGSYGSGNPGLQPQWQGSQGMQQPPAASSGQVFRSAGGGPPPPNAGPPGTGSMGNHRSYGGPPPPGAPQFRPPSNSPLNVAARGPTGPPPGQVSSSSSSLHQPFASRAG